jgi:hypothetical protein
MRSNPRSSSGNATCQWTQNWKHRLNTHQV